MPNFQPFERTSAQSTREPWVTIHKDGEAISINREALQLLQNPQAVELSFDPDAKLIGIRAAKSGEWKNYLLRSIRNGVQQISGRAFTRYWQIDTPVGRRYKVYLDGAYLIVDLKTECIEFTQSRRKLREKYQQGNRRNATSQI